MVAVNYRQDTWSNGLQLGFDLANDLQVQNRWQVGVMAGYGSARVISLRARVTLPTVGAMVTALGCTALGMPMVVRMALSLTLTAGRNMAGSITRPRVKSCRKRSTTAVRSPSPLRAAGPSMSTTPRRWISSFSRRSW